MKISIKLYLNAFHLVLQSDLKTEDFAEMSAPLLYDMFKAKSEFPLHFAIRHHREDVVFLFLIEFNAQVCSSHPFFTVFKR